MYSYKPHLMIIMLLSLWTMLVTPAQATCPISDHLCTYHALGRTQTSYNVDNDKTRLVIYGKALTTSHGDRRTDFDNHVLLPTETKYFDKSGNVVTEDTGPYINSRTSYAKRHDSDVGEWETPTTKGAHVYSSQYEVIFNKSTAKAIHSGDLNGGERGRTPYQSGCPDYENKANCEAVIITGNVPTGTYSQKIQMFNHYKKKNPKVNLELGAWATGQGTLVTPTHKGDNRFIFSNTQYNYTDLEGSKAQTQQFDYTFYNRGFNPHVMGTTSWDHNQRYHRVGVSGSFKNYNNRTGNIDIQQRIYSKKLTDTTTVDPFGQSTIQTKVGPVVSRDITLNSIGCTNGFFKVSCGQKGVEELNADGSMSKKGYELKAKKIKRVVSGLKDSINSTLDDLCSEKKLSHKECITKTIERLDELQEQKICSNDGFPTNCQSFELKDNIEATGKKPPHSKDFFSEYSSNEEYIKKASQKWGVDEGIISSILYLETSQGYYDKLISPLDMNNSVLPMNINTSYWGDTLGERQKLKYDASYNIDHGTKLIKAIQINLGDDANNLEKVGTLYNNTNAKEITSYGKRVKEIYDKKEYVPPLSTFEFYNLIIKSFSLPYYNPPYGGYPTR